MQIKKSLIITTLLLAFLIPAVPALAGPTDPPVTVVKLVNPIGGTTAKPEGLTDMRVFLGDIIQGIMGFAGSLILAVFIYGGFLWLTSAGNAEQVKKGSATMMWAAIGLFLIFGAYAILSLVLKAIGAKDQPATPIDTTGDVPWAEKEYQCECVTQVVSLDGSISPQSSIKEIPQALCEKDTSNTEVAWEKCTWEQVKK